MPQDATTSLKQWTAGRGVRAAAALLVVFGALTLIGVFASIGPPLDGSIDPWTDRVARVAGAFFLLVRAGTPALVYLLAAIGLGRLLSGLYRGAADPLAVQAGLGLALMLSLSHGLGCLGLLAGTLGMVVGGGVCLAGLGLLARQVVTHTGDSERRRIPGAALIAIPGVALMLVAACQPPGWLWSSEAGGYDALAYHLQLPQEWLAMGRIAPLEHNVYSFLPGYVESAFLHIGAMTGATAGPGAASRAYGLLAGEGFGVISAQLLHAGMGVLAALLIGRAVVRAAESAGMNPENARIGAAFGAALFLLTPWTVVVGSLAYNEMGMVALGAAALIAAMNTTLAPWRRGVVTGLLVGVACGCKPTALTLVGVPIGIVLLGLAPAKEWARIAAWGSGAGVLALAPWLARNGLATGNPVFPQLTSVFGNAHWSDEQVARYGNAHFFRGSLLERLSLLVRIDPSDPSGPRHRGMLHPQWFAFFPAVLAAAAVALVVRPSRRIGLLLSAALAAQAVLWMFTTHIQSRFLVPLVVPGCVLFGLAAAWRPRARMGPLWIPNPVALGLVAAQGIVAIGVFGMEGRGRPNALLAGGPAILTGEALRGPLARASAEERERFLAGAEPESLLNLTLPPGRSVYLLGGATPLYFAVPVVYNTTWDRWPLGEAMRANPATPGAWAGALRARGIDLILVNRGELGRLQRSGFADPLVTPEAASQWLDGSGRVVRDWVRTGQTLYELRSVEGGRP